VCLTLSKPWTQHLHTPVGQLLVRGCLCSCCCAAAAALGVCRARQAAAAVVAVVVVLHARQQPRGSNERADQRLRV
jgi:hypothetical protein